MLDGVRHSVVLTSGAVDPGARGAEEGFHDIPHRRWQRRRPERRLASAADCGQTALLNDLLQLAAEAQLHHAVHLVEHQVLHTVQLNDAALQAVDEPARGGHDNVSTMRQLTKLGAQALSAIKRDAPKRRILCERRRLRVNLLAQLASGHEHQRNGPCWALPWFATLEVRHTDNPRWRHQLPMHVARGRLELQGRLAFHDAFDLGKRRLDALLAVLGLVVSSD
mmetsp:Transcript_79900/g.205506  ORF Transcript_79900/g.205506 Transcript_79900/m.205506 type:complete len:223 (+) Transcript_79900:1021-1689(+)